MHVENWYYRRHATKTSSLRSAHRTVQQQQQRELNGDAPRADVPHADGQVQRVAPLPPQYRSCVLRARDAPHTFPLRAARTLSSPFKESSIFTFSSFKHVWRAYDLSKVIVPCGWGRSREGMILRCRGCGWNRRSRRWNVDGRLKLLPVLLLLLLLGLLLVIGTCAVPATSAPVEHPPRDLPP